MHISKNVSHPCFCLVHSSRRRWNRRASPWRNSVVTASNTVRCCAHCWSEPATTRTACVDMPPCPSHKWMRSGVSVLFSRRKRRWKCWLPLDQYSHECERSCTVLWLITAIKHKLWLELQSLSADENEWKHCADTFLHGIYSWLQWVCLKPLYE